MPQGLTIVNYTLLRLIETAYDARDFQIAGAPNWLTTDRFDINAKASNESKPTRDEIRLMLQALLRERFGLVREDAMKYCCHAFLRVMTCAPLGADRAQSKRSLRAFVFVCRV
jgi:uncharacterized protein (TIGR03435 family)